MVNAIIESVGIIYMKKQYDIDVAYSNLGYLGNILIEKKDEDTLDSKPNTAGSGK